MSSIKKISTAVLLTILFFCLVFSPVLMSPDEAKAWVMTVDVNLNPVMLLYTLTDWGLQKDMVRTNIQKQTSMTVAQGNAPPIPQGSYTASGTLTGLIAGIPATLVSGIANFRTAMKTLVKSVISNILKSLTDWAKGGFRGKPTFVSDWKGLIKASALDASAQFISSLPAIANLCSPQKISGSKAFFEMSLSNSNTAFSQYVQKEFKPTNKCTLETVFNNIENAPGDFKKSIDKLSKSWDKKGGSVMASALMNPSTNMLGAYFVAQDESMGRVAQNSTAKKEEAKANGGYLNIANGCIGGTGSGSARAPRPGMDARLPGPGIGGPGGTGVCGNGIRNPVNANGWPEQCDGGDLAGSNQCARFAEYQAGTLTCLPDCNYDYSACVKNTGTGNPITGEKFCPAVMAGSLVKDSMNKAGLGQFSDVIDMNDMNDLFTTLITEVIAGMTSKISENIAGYVSGAVKGISM